MSTFRSLSLERLRAERRSIWFAFAATVAAPSVALGAVWALAATTLGAGPGFAVASAGVVLVAASLFLASVFARRLAMDLRGIEMAAQKLAGGHAAGGADQISDGGRQPGAGGGGAGSRPFTMETARAAAAIAGLQRSAAAAAAGEASLREGIGKVFVSLARRNQSLLQRQLRLIDTLEQKATDPATLADLFRLDHLTTRMRRHAEGLIILSGAAPGRSWSAPVPVIDVIRAAVAEVEDYKRVVVHTRSEDAVLGSAAADLTHLLAELIENGTLFSPSDMRVEIRADRVTNGFAIEIDDRGLGIKPRQLTVINERLADPPDFDLANADQLGLFVVGRLAVRHGVRVELRHSPYGGITAVVLLPASLMVLATELDPDTGMGSRALTEAPMGALPAPGQAFALPGLRAPQPAPLAAAGAREPSGPAGASGSAPATDGAGASAATYRGLPRRVRQASMPETRGGAELSFPSGWQAPGEERSPEATRDLVSSLQQGWRRGRQEDAPPAKILAADQAPARWAGEVSEGEEA